MIACTRCGHRTIDDDEAFCISCGAFLPWTGESIERLPAPVVVAPPPLPPPPEPQKAKGLLPWFRRNVIKPWRDQWLPFENLPLDDVPTQAMPALPAVPASAELLPAPRDRSDRVLARKPGRPSPHHHLIEVDEDEDLPPGAVLVACGSCAVANPSTRMLCRRCGVDLAPPSQPVETPPPARRAWLPMALGLPDGRARPPATMRQATLRQREPGAGEGTGEDTAGGGKEGEGADPEGGATAKVAAAQKKADDAKKRAKAAQDKGKKVLKKLGKLMPGKKSSQPVAAGARPGKWGRVQYAGGNKSMLVLGKLGAGVIGIGLVLSFVGPVAQPLRNGATRVWHDVHAKLTIKYVPVAPVGATASSAASGFPAGNAIDNVVNDSWQTDAVSNGVGQWITLSFARPSWINAVGVLSGDQSTPQSYRTEARPRVLAFYWPDGHVSTENLVDQAGFQSFHVDERNVRSVRVVIKGVYPSSSGHRCAIAQLEFFHLT